MHPAELIEQKRNGGEHDPAELEALILGYARDEVPDYQMAAWCMAVYFN
jgi:pyrimidine-nucleoside phosphorylase